MREFVQRRLVIPLLALLRQRVSPQARAERGSRRRDRPHPGARSFDRAVRSRRVHARELNMLAIQFVNYLLTPLQLWLQLAATTNGQPR
jgi:hypothetical protein